MRFEVTTLPVADADRAKAFCQRLGWPVDTDIELGKGPVPGPDPEGRSYLSLASFSDPDGNQWPLQEVTERIPRAV
jgi:hypothetical protein